MMHERQIIYILSTNYAGSHFLALQLGSHSQCMSIGEFHHFKRNGKKRRQACHLCENDEVCPLFRGLSRLSLSELYHYLFINLNEMNPNVHTVIDNSKKTRWADRFVDMPGVRQKYIHLIRDPRALIRRWMLAYETSSQKTDVRRLMSRRCWKNFWSILTGSEANVYIWKWVYQNQLITDFIRREQLDARVVTYHDLVWDADRILLQLMNWIGLEYEPVQTRYWQLVHHGSVKAQYMQAPKEGHKIFDQRWKGFLDEDTQRVAVTHPAVLEYLDKIGLRFDAKAGLVFDSGAAGRSFII